MERGTNTVQGFIRFIIWVVVAGLGTAGLLPPTSRYISAIGRMTFGSILGWGTLLLIGYSVVIGLACIVAGMFYVLPEWERLVLLRIGKFAGIRGPGLFVIPPFLYSVASVVNMQIRTEKVEATATLTKDNVPTTVTAAIEYEIEDPQKVTIRVKDFLKTIIWVATEALKNTIGQLSIQELLGEREKVSAGLQEDIDKAAANYGVNIRAVRITDIDTPADLLQELAVIARAERAAKAKKIEAEAEVQVAESLKQAADLLAQSPVTLQLRQIQALLEMSKEEGAMIIVYPAEGMMGQQIAAAAAGARITGK